MNTSRHKLQFGVSGYGPSAHTTQPIHPPPTTNHPLPTHHPPPTTRLHHPAPTTRHRPLHCSLHLCLHGTDTARRAHLTLPSNGISDTRETLEMTVWTLHNIFLTPRERSWLFLNAHLFILQTERPTTKARANHALPRRARAQFHLTTI